MVITILTLFPEMFSGPFQSSIIKRSVDKKLIKINIVNIRDFGIGKHKVVDDTPYGGGVGMVMRVDVLVNALESIPKKKKQKRILLSASGAKFDQKKAREFSKLEELILICGHYEGVDARISKYIDGEISIGDYVLTGGEIPAMVITDAVLRLVPRVLKKDATELESFSVDLIEHNQYTKPPVFREDKVPQVLTSGNHKKILQWRNEESIKRTRTIRPDLLKREV
jgi:tRNA (guanine37-N1)-methyltransferase